MKRTWLIGLTALVIAFLLPSVAFAGGDAVSTSSTIYFTDACTGAQGCNTRGGPFNMWDAGTNAQINVTFCLEVQEFINWNTNYSVHSIGPAIRGGVDVANADGVANQDPVSAVTASLYILFRNGTLASIWDPNGGGTITGFELDVIQTLIWLQEDEITGPGVNGVTSLMTTEAANLLTIIQANLVDNATGLVAAINPVSGTTHKQSMLVLIDGGERVPEPSTLLLLGSGLIALRLFSRRRH